MARPVTIKILIEGGDSEKTVRRLTDAFDQTERAARRAAQASASVADKDVFARAAQASRQFLNEMINSGGMRQYQEVLRQFAPQLRALQEQLKQGSFNQEDFNRRLAAMPPLLQRALRDVSSLGKGIKSFGDEAEHGANGLQRMLIQADLAGRTIAFLTEKITEGWTEYKNFGKEIANVDTILSDGANVNKFRDGILQLPPELGKATELTKGLYQALSSGVSEADALKFLADSAKAAKAGVAEVKDTVDASTTIIASYNLEAKKVVDIYDKMFETVKRGKVEMPQLAQSIGQVSAIASLAGVTLNELFAAVATSTLTNKPSVAIEGLRTALSNIIKPSEQAIELSQKLGLEFNAAALRSKGLANFLAEVSAKTGNSADKLAVLFGDVQGFNIVATLAGSNAKKFAENLDAMGNASGNVEKAFAKQQQSLATQFENFTTRVMKGLIGTFQSVEPAVKFVLAALNLLLPVIVAVTVAVSGLKLAWLLLNTQLFVTAGAGVGNVIAALQLLWQTLLSVAAGTASLQASLAVATGGLALVGAAVGLAIYYFSTMETAIDRANKVTLDSINANSQSLQSYQNLAAEAQAVAQAQEGSSARHERLNAIIGKLEPATQAYIKALADEQQQISAVTAEIDRNVETRKAALEAQLRVMAEGIIEQQSQIKSLTDTIGEWQTAIRDIEALKAKPANTVNQNELTKLAEARDRTILWSEAIVDAQAQIEQLSSKLGENEVKLIQAAKGLGLTNDQLREFFTRAGYSAQQTDALTAAYQKAVGASDGAANSLNKTTDAVNQQTQAVFNLRNELNKLSGAYQEKIDQKVLDIVKVAKDKAEAAKLAREALKIDADLKKAVDETKRIRDTQKAAEDVFIPSEQSSSGTSRRTRTPNPLADFRRENRVISGNAQWDKFVYEFAAKYGVDPMLIFAQMQQESSFKRGAVSNKGASGLMQLMPGTARDLGVKNIFDPKQNIEAGVKYLRQQLDRFGGNTALALAAYNAGPGAVIKHNGIPPYKETQDYVKRISANYQRIKGRPEYGSGFDYERSMQEQSDRLTEQAARDRAAEAMRMLRVGGIMPDSDAMQDIIKMRQDDARKSGLARPEADAIRRELESQARSTATGEGIQVKQQKTILETIRERYNLEDREAQMLLRKQTIDKEVAVALEDQALARREATVQAQIDLKVLQQRNVGEEAALGFLESRVEQLRAIGAVEIDLMVLHRQNADDQFVKQRRLLAAKREQLSLEQEITQLQDEIANGGVNDALKIQAAQLRDIIDLREREVEAVIAVNRAELELSKSMEISNNQVRARVLGHLAQQKTLNDAIADGIIGTYEAVADRAGAALDKLNEKTKGFLSFIIEPAKAIQRNFLTNITRGLLDKLFPGLGTEVTKTNNPIARPIVDEQQKTNNILERIAGALGAGRFGFGSGSSGGGLNLGSIFGGNAGGGIFNLGGNQPGFPYAMNAGGGSTRPRIVDGQPIRSVGSGSWWSNLKNLFSTNEGGIFARRGGDGTPGSGSRMAGILGGIGDIASVAGGLIGGRWGGVISLAGTGMSVGAMFGPIGAAIGAGAGALLGFLMGDPKRKRDKEEKLPQLNQGFVDSFKELQQLIEDVRFFRTDADSALSRGRELRAQIASGFGIQFESKKYRKESQKIIQAKLAEIDRQPDGLWAQLEKAVAEAKRSGDRAKRILPEFASGNYFADYFKPNGLLPGMFDRKDDILALISRGEMVLNPQQIARVRANAGGIDPFANAGIPNYQPNLTAKPPRRQPRFETGAFVGGSLAAGALASGKQEIHLHGNFEVRLSEDEISRVVLKTLESDEGNRVTFDVVNDGKKKGRIK